MLLRHVLGDTLRGHRLAQQRTLREVSAAARVSLGYLSEVERGRKEASSELVRAICTALGLQLSDLLREISDTLVLVETGALDTSRRLPVLEPVAPNLTQQQFTTSQIARPQIARSQIAQAQIAGSQIAQLRRTAGRASGGGPATRSGSGTGSGVVAAA